MGADPLLALLAGSGPGPTGLAPRRLDELAERVVLLGGTVDTAAQELGILDERSALDLLGRATGLPALGRVDISALESDTLGVLRTTLPRRLALAHGLCPVAWRGRRLTVACRVPGDPAAFASTLDELGFALALTLVPHVTTEALLALAWEAVYGVAVPPRLQAVLTPGVTGRAADVVVGDRSGWSAISSARASTPTPTPAVHDATIDHGGWHIPRPGEAVLPPAHAAPLDRAALALIEEGTIPGDAPALQARLAALDDSAARALQKRRQKVLWSEGDCVAELALGTTRDELLEVMLRFAYRRLRTAAIFVKQGDGLVCFDVLDPLLEPRELRRFVLPADERTVIGKAMALQSPMLGPVDDDDPLCRLLGRRPRALVVAPIVLGGRSIGAIVGDNDDKPIPAQLVGELQRVLPSLQRALAGLIQRARAVPPTPSARAAPAPVVLPPTTASTSAPPTTMPPIGTTASTTLPPTTTATTTLSPTAMPTTAPAIAPSPGRAARESLLQATWRSWLQAPVDDDLAALVHALQGGGGGARAAYTRLLALGLAAMPAFAHALPGTVGVDGAGDDDGDAFLEGPIGATLLRVGGDLVAPIAVGALDDPDPRRRFAAAALARALHLEAAVPGLGRRVLDPEPRVARLATLALLALRDAPASAAVRARLRDLCKRGHDQERRLAIRAVAALRDEGAVEPLIDLVGTRPRELADEATAALVELCRQDFGGAERRWRAWYTEHQHEPRRRWLLLALSHKERALRAAAADELADDGVPLMGFHADAPASEREAALARLCAALGEPVPT